MLEKFTITTFIGGLVAFLFGPIDGILMTLIAVLIICEVTGILAAIYEKRLSSAENFKSIIKIILTMAVVVVANLIDIVAGLGGVLRTFVIIALIGNGSITILEDVARCNIPIPQRLLDTLETLKGKGDGLESTDDDQ